ncbi:MAG: PQQ-binding-like beta-propeller repeat protein [Planctomycetota bacterium]|nr:PQQ-binding-like beta-propeller repeat protein [Planctomycetota bacterium]
MRLSNATVVAAILLAAAAAQLHAENWPQWRGPFFNGSTTEKGLPAVCDPSTQLWVTDLPGHSSATPIIWGDRVFISSTDPESKGLLAMCLAAADGKVLWKNRVAGDIKLPRNNGASPSPCTDGKLVYFLYGSGDLAALWKGRLYVLLIRRTKPYPSAGGQPDKPLDPLIVAIDPATGKDLWQHVRPSDSQDESLEAYGTAIPYEGKGRTELLIDGGGYLSGHDPETGREFWRYGYNASQATIWRHIPSPVAWEDLIFGVVSRGGPTFAVKAGGSGLLGADGAVWKFGIRKTDSGTSLVYENSLYILQSDKADPVVKGSYVSPGIFLFCVDPRTGKDRAQIRLADRGAWRASPTGADGKIYCLSEEGEVVVVEAGGDYKILSRTKLGDGETQATIAVSGGRVYVRTATKLYCFGKNAK